LLGDQGIKNNKFFLLVNRFLTHTKSGVEIWGEIMGETRKKMKKIKKYSHILSQSHLTHQNTKTNTKHVTLFLKPKRCKIIHLSSNTSN
jgi:hypothetical protein